MNSIALDDVKEATRFIYYSFSPPASLVMSWKKGLKALLASTVSQNQLDYAITSSSAIVNRSLKEGFQISEAAVQLVLLFKHYSEKQNEHRVSSRLEELLNKWDGDWENIEVSHLIEKIEREEYLVELKVDSTIQPLVWEQIVRWAVLFIFVFKSSAGNWDLDAYGLIQYGAIPLVFLVYWYFRYRKVQKYNQQLLLRMKLRDSVRIQRRSSTFYFTFIFLVLIYGMILLAVINGFDSSTLIPIMISTLVFATYLSIYHQFSIGRLNEKKIRDQLDEKIHFDQKLDVDENDVVIVALQSKLKSITGRLEAYVLESALLGALSFSGFLQIMAGDLIGFEDLKLFSENIQALLASVLSISRDSSTVYLEYLAGKEALFSLISIETLICSVLFLAVIASRLIFSNESDRIAMSLDYANAFNQKEEELVNATGKIDGSRVQKINDKIHEELHKAYEYLDDLTPTTSYMQFFRNAGLLFFLFVLITSGFLISSFLSLIFTLLAIASVIYFNRRVFLRMLNNLLFTVQLVAVNHSIWIIGMSIGFVMLATITSMFLQFKYFYIFLVLALLFFLIYRMIVILLSPLYDEQFDSERSISREIRIVWALSEAMIMLGMFLILSHLPGGGASTGLGFTLFALILSIVSFRLTKKWYFGLLASLAIIPGTFAIVFKILYLPGSKSLAIIAAVFCILYLIFYYYRPTLNHRIIKSMVFGLLMLLLYATSYRTHRIILYTQTSNIGEINKVITFFRDLNNLPVVFTDTGQIERAIKNGLYLKDKYNSEVQQTLVRRYCYLLSYVAIEDERVIISNEEHLDKLYEVLDTCKTIYPYYKDTQNYKVALGKLKEAESRL